MLYKAFGGSCDKDAMACSVCRLLRSELAKVWRTKFPYLGLGASMLAALVARQSTEVLSIRGELTASSYLTTSLNVCSTLVVPIFATIFAAMLVASESSRGTLRYVLTRPISRSSFLSAKLLSGLFYLGMLFAANLVLAIPIALQYPWRAAFDEGAPIPNPSEQVGIFAVAVALTIFSHVATVCFGFFVSVLSVNVATAIGVAVGVLLSLLPVSVLLDFGDFKPGEWFFNSYWDTATAIASDKVSGIYSSWNGPPVMALLAVCGLSSLVFLVAAYVIFNRRDLNI